jgi:predicted PurR-regulated permease PerM
LRPIDKKTVQVLFTGLVFALGLLFLYAAWRVIIAFLFAVFFAYLLEAPVSRLETVLKGSRPAAIGVVYLIFVALLVVVFVLAGPPIIEEVQTLTQQSPHLSETLTHVGTQHGWSAETVERIQNYINQHRGEIVSRGQQIVLGVIKTLQSMWWLLLVPILAIFFLKDGRKFGSIIINSVQGQRNRQIMAATVEKMNSMLGHFLRAQVLLSALAMVVITFTIWLMRVPYAFALGPAAGALEFIPVVGPVLGGAFILGVAFLAGYNHVLWLFIFLLVWRGIQDYVTSPRIMGNKLELHPLAILFGVLAGGEVAGVIGVFLSIPALASLRILWHTWRLYRSSVPVQHMDEEKDFAASPSASRLE